jgi:hypothetical protein
VSEREQIAGYACSPSVAHDSALGLRVSRGLLTLTRSASTAVERSTIDDHDHVLVGLVVLYESLEELIGERLGYNAVDHPRRDATPYM